MKKNKLSLCDVWEDPLLCRDGLEFTLTRSNLAQAWDQLVHPGYFCWFLDFVYSKFQFVPKGNLRLDDLKNQNLKGFQRRFYRMILYEDFLKYELGLPSWWIPVVMGAIRKNSTFSTWFFWFITGYFDSRRPPQAPAHWWIYTIAELRLIYYPVRDLLSEVD